MQFSAAVTTVTRKAIPKKIFDTVTLGTPGLMTFMRTAKDWNTGTSYAPVIQYQDTTNGGNTGIANQLDSDRQNTRVSMDFEVKMAYKPVVIADIEATLNKGDEQIVSLLEAEFDTQGKSLLNVMAQNLYSGTGVGDASVRYHASPGLWLSTGSEFYFRAHHTSVLAAGNIFRFGLANAIANATGQIADGIYFELNGSTGAASMCCTATGSTYSRTVSSYSPTVSKWTWYIIKLLSTGVAFYTDGNNTPIATIYNNYPGATARASRVFWQCAGTGLPNYKGIMVDKIAYPYIVSSLPSGLYL